MSRPTSAADAPGLTPGRPPALRLSGVTGDGVQDVTLDVAAGEMVGIAAGIGYVPAFALESRREQTDLLTTGGASA